MRLNENARCWTVKYTRIKEVSRPDGRIDRWHYNHCATVIAMSVATAITETLLVYPDATIVSVHPGPGSEVIVGSETEEKTI